MDKILRGTPPGTLPRLMRLGLLVNVTNQLHVPQLRETKIAAEASGILLVPVEVGSPDKVDSAFAMLGREGVEALLVPPDTTFYSRRRQIADLGHICRRFMVIASMSKMAGS